MCHTLLAADHNLKYKKQTNTPFVKGNERRASSSSARNSSVHVCPYSDQVVFVAQQNWCVSLILSLLPLHPEDHRYSTVLSYRRPGAARECQAWLKHLRHTTGTLPFCYAGPHQRTNLALPRHCSTSSRCTNRARHRASPSASLASPTQRRQKLSDQHAQTGQGTSSCFPGLNNIYIYFHF
jgi:hypothetical protein